MPKHQTIKIKIRKNETAFSIIKKYAEKHTALFTAICSGLVAFLTVVLKLCYFSYQYGRLTAFNININTIDLIKDTTIFNILFYIVLAITMLSLNYLGYIFYRKNALIKYLLVFLIIFLILSPIIFANLIGFSTLNLIKVADINDIFLIIFFSIIIVLSIHMIVIINAISPSINDLYCRLEDKHNKFIDKYDINNIKEQKHIKKYNKILKKLLVKKAKIIRKESKKKEKINIKEYNLETLQEMEGEIDEFIKEYELKLKKQSKNKDIKSNLFVNLIATSITIVFIVGFLFVLGYVHSSDFVKINIIENTSYFVENENKIDCAIIYENEEYIIVSPCYEEDNKLIVNTSYQYRTENSNITKHNIAYDTITITQFDDLTEYCKTE